MTTKVIEEKWELNKDVSDITERDLAAKTVDGSLQPVWEYPVPVGYSIVFSREDIFSAYLDDNEGSPAESVAGTRIDVVIMDSAKQNVRSLLNPLRYGGVKEFQDVDKLIHLDIAAGEDVVAKEGERICVRVDSGGAIETIDGSDSYFRLTCKRIRHTLF